MWLPLAVLSWFCGLADYVYYFVKPRVGKDRRFFHEGYGDAVLLRSLHRHVAGLVPGLLNPQSSTPTVLQAAVKEISINSDQLSARNGSISCTQSSFTSPLADHLPQESRRCYFSVLEPPAARPAPSGTPIKAVCVMLPATADTGTGLRRKLYADELAKQGVVGVLVTAPFYGPRKPAGQHAWFLRQVADAFAQAWGVALEATALLHWARQRWRVPLAVTGVSYGAAMAALTSKLYPGPLAVVPFMGCSGPGEPFADGVLRASVYWSALQRTPGLEHDLPEAEQAQHAARSPAAVRRSFVDYCVHFTSTAPWEQHIPDSMHGAHALVMLQALHDKFVFFEDGKKLFDDLKRVASAPGRAWTDTHSGKVEEEANGQHSTACVGGDWLEAKAPLLLKEGAAATEVGIDSELIEVVGGHVTGFLQCRWLLPQAVMSALARLQAKQGLTM